MNAKRRAETFNPEYGIVDGTGGMGKLVYDNLRLPNKYGLDIKKTGPHTNPALSGIVNFHNGQPGVLFPAFPEHVAQEALTIYQQDNKRALKTAIGIKGVGKANLLTVFLDSLQHYASQVYSAMAGPVIGMHQMHGPKVPSLASQNVILGVTPAKQNHHLYEASKTWLISFLEEMGYDKQNIGEMTVEKHDKLMTDVQFLSHTLFLVLASAVKKKMKTENYSSENIPEWIHEAVLMSQRILSGESHVYRNIAIHNPHNPELLQKLIQKMQSIPINSNFEEMAKSLFTEGQTVLQEYLQESEISDNEKKYGKTPVSGTRDGIIAKLQDQQILIASMPDTENTVIQALCDYERSLKSPKTYDEHFEELQNFFPERNIGASNPIIAKYST